MRLHTNGHNLYPVFIEEDCTMKISAVAVATESETPRSHELQSSTATSSMTPDFVHKNHPRDLNKISPC